jgi:hypothetical protein
MFDICISPYSFHRRDKYVHIIITRSESTISSIRIVKFVNTFHYIMNMDVQIIMDQKAL